MNNLKSILQFFPMLNEMNLIDLLLYETKYSRMDQVKFMENSL